jgi:myosin protein heavy chain
MSSLSGQKRNNPFARTGSQSPGPGSRNERPVSMVIPSPLTASQTPPRNQSFTSLAGTVIPNANHIVSQHRSNSKTSLPASNTFAPSFIKTEEMRQGSEPIKGIEGENDFSGKRYVWLKDADVAFVRGWIVEDLSDNRILCQCDDGSVC